jgi:acetylornithine deacetylase/succinyl-diaminopimelate desuccinylase-like protein
VTLFEAVRILAEIFTGYLDVKLTVEKAGGHSSVPPDHTGIGILSRIISAIEAAPYEPELTPAHRQSSPSQ